MSFDSDMVLKLKKDLFLSNTANKQLLIKLLGEKLQLSGCNIIHAPGDADLMIVQMAIQSSKSIITVLVGDDADLLVLLCDSFLSQSKGQRRGRFGTSRKPRLHWDQKPANILFVHVVLRCNTTSETHRIGKGFALKKIMKDAEFQEQADNNEDNTISDIIAAGEKVLVCLYNGRSDESLDSLRYWKFYQKITTGTSFVQPECLPPTSAAVVWRGVALRPQDWGWKSVDGSLLPIRTDLRAAHASLLVIISCNCKSDCGSKRCSCRKTWTELFGCMW